MFFDIPATVLKRKIGAWGEALTAMCLEMEHDGLEIANIGRSYVPYDILVLDPNKNTFKRPTLMSVKTRTTNAALTPPSYKEYKEMKASAASSGMDLYLSIVHYHFNDKGLAFGIYIIPGSKITKKDFVPTKGWEGRNDMLRIVNIRKKARWRYYSDDASREQWPTATDVFEAGSPRRNIGDWGEVQTMMLLETRYKPRQLEVSKFDEDSETADLYVLEPARGTPFTKRAAISCKTLERKGHAVRPSEQQWKDIMKDCKARKEQFWLSITRYRYTNRHLTFATHIIDMADMDRNDFTDVNIWGDKEKQVRIMRAIEKAKIKFNSKRMRREE